MTSLVIRLCTSKLTYYIKVKTKTSQSADCRETPWTPFSARFNATANELDQERTQFRWYEEIILARNCHKIWKKIHSKMSAKKTVKLKMKCKIILT